MKVFYIIFLLIFFPISSYCKTTLDKISPNLSYLWGLSILNDKEVLYTQRSGKIFKLNVYSKQNTKILDVSDVYHQGQGGLLDIIIDQDDKKTKVILCLSRSLSNFKASTSIYSFDLIQNTLLNKKTLFTANNPSKSSHHFGCRLAINDNFIFATIGDRGDRTNSQNLKNHSGSVIKILKNGKDYNNNAFKNALPEILTIGHRNPQGLAFDPKNKQLWLHEHGPQGGDEVNIILKGKNYGWPIVTHGKEYGSGNKIGQGLSKFGYEDPVWVWVPSIAPSGMIFYQGNMFSEFKNSIILVSLKFNRLHILTIKNNIPINEKIILENKIGRIRDIEEMNDGSLIIINDEKNGGVYRLYKE
jgi:glucose/arabinose dehydrogenase